LFTGERPQAMHGSHKRTPSWSQLIIPGLFVLFVFAIATALIPHFQTRWEEDTRARAVYIAERASVCADRFRGLPDFETRMTAMRGKGPNNLNDALKGAEYLVTLDKDRGSDRAVVLGCSDILLRRYPAVPQRVGMPTQ